MERAKARGEGAVTLKAEADAFAERVLPADRSALTSELFLRQNRLNVQIDLRTELRNDERYPVLHQTIDVMNIAAQPIELGNRRSDSFESLSKVSHHGCGTYTKVFLFEGN